MRNMSFSMTTQAMYERRKTVTRRSGWWNLKAGDIVMAVEKCQGLKKGEKMVRIYPIKILSVRDEPLNTITKDDLVLEGFPNMTCKEFVDMYCKHNQCERDRTVNRIEFAPSDLGVERVGTKAFLHSPRVLESASSVDSAHEDETEKG